MELREEFEESLGTRVSPEDKSSLTIAYTRKHHEGNYTCVFRNDDVGLIIVKGES